MIRSIVHARLLHFYPPKLLPLTLTLNCYCPPHDFRVLCPPATYLDTPGLASDVSCTGEINPIPTARKDGYSHFYSRFVLEEHLIKPLTIDFGGPVCKFCTTLSLLTHVSPSSSVSWLVTQKRTIELTRAWMARRLIRQGRTAAAAIKRKRGANDEMQCSNIKSSSEDNTHTIWTDDSKNFGLMVKIEGSTSLLDEAEFMPRNRRLEPPASYTIHIQGV